MILVDTSVWVDHLRSTDEILRELLERSQVVMHPAVFGELSLGNLPRREEVLRLLHGLPRAVVATDAEVAELIESSGLHGRGIGYVDASLLASARLSTALLWTRDGRLARAARELSVDAGLL